MQTKKQNAAADSASTMTEAVYTVRAFMADESTVDLLVFGSRVQAERYIAGFRPLPLGFDHVAIVERRIIGTIDRARQ